MSSALVKHVALAGAGNFGSFALKELLATDLTVTVLTRIGSDKTFDSSVKVASVDYSSPSSLEAALKGIDAVVSTLSDLGAQTQLIHAAKSAGVKLFVPSEFGNPSDQLTKEAHPIIYGKKNAQEVLKSVGLPALLVWTGPFTDTVFAPFFGFDFQHKKVSLVGKGDTPISFTSRIDAARFLAHYLSTLTTLPSPTAPAVLRLEGDRQTFASAVALYESLHADTKLDVQHEPLEDAEKIAKDLEGAGFVPSFLKYLLVSWEKGATVDQGKGVGVLSGKDWPEWKPQTVEDILKTL
ncbi:hypothetical protein JCM21900_001636 [Sporobolomyces salmonicolor]